MKLPLGSKRVVLLFFLFISCGERKPGTPSSDIPVAGTFAYDVAFMRAHKNVFVLGTSASLAKVLVAGDYQARVMTSTAGGENGNSYGWINYAFIESGKTSAHMNPYGGEDRFWLGPEGGQYAIFFKKGDEFDYAHWQTPAVIDTEHFDLVSSDSLQATFRKSSTLTNFKGTTFQIDIHRKIRLLSAEEVEEQFNLPVMNLKMVSFESNNAITNKGDVSWTKREGLLSIWILGMFAPSPEAVVILPHKKPGEGGGVTDNYFGIIPAERLVKSDSFLIMKGDGKYRGKVGIAPTVAHNIIGSYDPGRHLLTLVKFDLDEKGEYVNSKWEIQKQPYGGDAVNAYNDGSSFYELESSSPAKELKPGESIAHRHITLHIEGNEDELNVVAERVLGVSLTRIKIAFQQ